jgi:hypothetical protein
MEEKELFYTNGKDANLFWEIVWMFFKTIKINLTYNLDMPFWEYSQSKWNVTEIPTLLCLLGYYLLSYVFVATTK